MKARCPICERLIGVAPIAHGDGSAVRIRRHGGGCMGSGQEVDLAETVEEE